MLGKVLFQQLSWLQELHFVFLECLQPICQGMLQILLYYSELHPPTPDYYAYNFVTQYKDAIIKNATKYNVQPEFVVGVLLSENYERLRWDDIKDRLAITLIGRILDLDPSLGVSQIKVSTAQLLNERFGRNIKEDGLIKLLQDPEANIEYNAMHLFTLENRKNRTPKQPSNILDDPHRLAIIATEHFRGPTNSSLEEAKPSSEGLSLVLSIAQTDFSHFGEGFTITTAQRQRLEDYVRHQLSSLNLK